MFTSEQNWSACLCRKWMWTCNQGLHLWKWYAGMNCMGRTVWTGSASVNEICTFELAMLLRDVNQLTWCFTCKMFARMWMRHTHENEVCTCDPVYEMRFCGWSAYVWTGQVRPANVCASVKHMRTCEWRWESMNGELAVENRATYLLTGHLRCE